MNYGQSRKAKKWQDEIDSKNWYSSCGGPNKNVAWAAQQREGPSITGMVVEEWKWRKTALLREFHSQTHAGIGARPLLQEIVWTSQWLCQHLLQAATMTESLKVDLITTKVIIDVIFFFLFGPAFGV
jgi:hypothetical protein